MINLHMESWLCHLCNICECLPFVLVLQIELLKHWEFPECLITLEFMLARPLRAKGMVCSLCSAHWLLEQARKMESKSYKDLGQGWWASELWTHGGARSTASLKPCPILSSIAVHSVSHITSSFPWVLWASPASQPNSRRGSQELQLLYSVGSELFSYANF